MVAQKRLLSITWGEYKLFVVGPVRELWPPTADVSTVLRLQPHQNVAVEALGRNVVVDQETVRLARPVLHENASVDVYLEGPAAGSLETRPRAATAQMVHVSRAVQHYRVTYRGAVGDVAWDWITPTGRLRILLEVFPSKIDYRRDYEAIRAELLDVAPQLTMSLTGGAGEGFTSAQSPQATDLEWLEHIQREHARLSSAMEALLPRLRSEAHREIQPVPIDRLRRSKPVARRDYRLLSQYGRPSHIPVETVSTTRQTPLNGYLRWELDQLLSAAGLMLSQDWIDKVDAPILEAVRTLSASSRRWIAAMEDVQPVPHPALLHTRLKDPQYATVISALRRLRWSLRADEEASLVGLKDLPTLYEYWVYLTVVNRLALIFPVVLRRRGAAVRRVGGELVLGTGVEATVVLADAHGRTVRCQYNRRFVGLPTTGQRPDSVIEVEGQGGMLVIDAKYRLGRDGNYLARFGTTGPLEEDINVLHRYRDAIVQSQPPHRRLVTAGLIAFPSSETRRYRAHRFCRSWPAVWVGGVPLLPGAVELLDEALDQFFAAGPRDVEE